MLKRLSDAIAQSNFANFSRRPSPTARSSHPVIRDQVCYEKNVPPPFPRCLCRERRGAVRKKNRPPFVADGAAGSSATLAGARDSARRTDGVGCSARESAAAPAEVARPWQLPPGGLRRQGRRREYLCVVVRPLPFGSSRVRESTQGVRRTRRGV